jgi:chemotaxis protein MotB
LSSDRAATLRRLMVEAGTAERRIQRTTGFADRKPAVADPIANRNNRIEIVLLRQNR